MHRRGIFPATTILQFGFENELRRVEVFALIMVVIEVQLIGAASQAAVT